MIEFSTKTATGVEEVEDETYNFFYLLTPLPSRETLVFILHLLHLFPEIGKNEPMKEAVFMYKIDRSYVDDYMPKNNGDEIEKSRAPAAGPWTDPDLIGRVQGLTYQQRLRAYHVLVRYWMPRIAPRDHDRMHRALADICDI